MVSFETLKTKSYYISIMCFFKGRMLWNDISCIVCIVISMQPPPDSDFVWGTQAFKTYTILIILC